MTLNKRIFGVVAMMALWFISGAFCATGDPVAVPTFHCIGLYWGPEEGREDIACDVRYRPANSGEWKEAMSLWFDARGPEEHSQMLPDRRNRVPKPQHDYARQYRGSIVSLTPGTEYEVELSLQNTGIQRRINVSTWSENFPIGKMFVLPETSSETLSIEESGSPDGYILYTVAPGGTATIDGENEIDHCVAIRASYVIIRGLNMAFSMDEFRHMKGVNSTEFVVSRSTTPETVIMSSPLLLTVPVTTPVCVSPTSMTISPGNRLIWERMKQGCHLCGLALVTNVCG
jgi:hypothetical protein